MSSTRLALYHFEGCPYCHVVRRAIDQLGVEVELRDIYSSEAHLQELLAATGRKTVPVLRIQTSGGEVGWLPESAHIVAWLRRWAAAAPRNGVSPAA